MEIGEVLSLSKFWDFTVILHPKGLGIWDYQLTNYINLFPFHGAWVSMLWVLEKEKGEKGKRISGERIIVKKP